MPSMILRILLTALAATCTVQALPGPIPQEQRPNTNTPPPPAPDNTALILRLASAPTVVDRFKALLFGDGKLLPQEEIQKRVVYDFNNAVPAQANGKVAQGGAAKSASISTFPILTDLGISVTMGFLNKCGINTPHLHPRATEFLTVVEGEIQTGFILENSFTSQISGNVKKYQGTVFPMGSIHYQFNPTCKPATFVAALNNEDPGTSQIAQNFFGLNPGVINATLGAPVQLDGKDIDQFEASLPLNLAQDIHTCLKRCNDAGQ